MNGSDSIRTGDYYVENGRYVFTREYLLRRGYCCENGCRHCPYGFRKQIAGTGSDSRDRTE